MRGRLAIAAALALGACMGPRPEPPKEAAITLPPAWRGDTGTGADAAIAPDWWTAFGDPVLAGLVATALAHNDDIAIAARRVEEARAQQRLARSALLPTLNLQGAAQRVREVSPFGTPDEQNESLTEAALSFDTDLFGRLRAGNAAARAAALASEGSRDTIRLAVIAQTASGYITLRALDARLETARATLADRADALRIARRRAEVGYTSQLELAQAEGEYQATAQLVPAAELAVTRQEDGLSILIGESPRAIERGAALDTLAAPAVPNGLPADLLRRRPDIFAAEEQLVAADHSLTSARRAFLPDLKFQADGGAVFSSLIEPNPITIWTIGGSVLAPIFEGGRLRAQADTAAARRDQVAFAYRKTALTAFREVEDALAAVKRTGEQVDALKGQVDALARALHYATNRYRAGYAPYLDQLDAQRGLLNAQLGLIQARADHLAAYVTLYQAMGGGWSAPAPSARPTGKSDQ